MQPEPPTHPHPRTRGASTPTAVWLAHPILPFSCTPTNGLPQPQPSGSKQPTLLADLQGPRAGPSPLSTPAHTQHARVAHNLHIHAGSCAVNTAMSTPDNTPRPPALRGARYATAAAASWVELLCALCS
jgi:hypothetical protein